MLLITALLLFIILLQIRKAKAIATHQECADAAQQCMLDSARCHYRHEQRAHIRYINIVGVLRAAIATTAQLCKTGPVTRRKLQAILDNLDCHEANTVDLRTRGGFTAFTDAATYAAKHGYDMMYYGTSAEPYDVELPRNWM